MKRTLTLLYGTASYVLFLGVFVYAIGFLGNFSVPRTLDSAPVGPLGTALAINLGLALAFALQHSGMARPSFKRWWTRFVPEPIERATYVLASSLAMILLYWLWQPLGQPLGGVVWDVQHPVAGAALYGLYGLGWLGVLITTFLINHFDLFGLRQVWLYFRGKPYRPVGFVNPGPYRLVRHPLYASWLVVFWATPTMSTGHLLLSVAITGYILVAIKLEERNLVQFLGKPYADYLERVPSLVPFTKGRRTAERAVPVSVEG